MKKFLLTILAFVYLGVSTGATIHVHYCMGKLVNIGLVNKSSSRCDKCGMATTQQGKGCCHDEQHFVKIEKDQNTTTAAYQIMQFSSIAVPSNYFELSPIATGSIIHEYPVTNVPPVKRLIPIFLLNRNFRI